MFSKNKINLIVLSIFLFSILLIDSYSASLNETFKKQLTITSKPFLGVKNSNGRIDLKAWDKNEILIIAHIRVEGDNSDAEKIMDRIEIEVEQNGDNIFVETMLPSGLNKSTGLLSWLFGRSPWSVSVDYEITVPHNSDLNLRTSNGRISIEEVAGNIRLSSTNGKINAKKVSGAVTCETTNGKVIAEFSEINTREELIFKTTNGSIKVYLPEDFGGYADLKTTNGRINSDFSLYGNEHRSKRFKNSFRGEIAKGDGSIKCKTTNGSIYLVKQD
jgi:hypothetical protein